MKRLYLENKITSLNRKKLLIVTRNFPPLTGGMEKLIYNIYSRLRLYFDTKIIGPRGVEKYAEKDALHSFPHSPVALFLLSSIWQTLRGIKKYRPDLILSGSGITALAALISGRSLRVPVITLLHGLDITVNNWFYQTVFLPSIRACNGVIVNSSFTEKLAIKYGVKRQKINILNPGTNIPSIKENKNLRKKFRHKINAGKRPIILSVGRLTPRKGIKEFLINCMDSLLAVIPDVLFVIAGGEAKDAVNVCRDADIRIKEIVESRGYSQHVVMLGKVSDDLLHQAYISSDLLVFPVLDLPGDVEGFGMVAIEAAAHGLPTVAFAAGGVIDAVKDGVSGRLIEPGKYDSFSEAIVRFIRHEEQDVSAASCREFAQSFSWLLFEKKMLDICSKFIADRK